VAFSAHTLHVHTLVWHTCGRRAPGQHRYTIPNAVSHKPFYRGGCASLSCLANNTARPTEKAAKGTPTLGAGTNPVAWSSSSAREVMGDAAEGRIEGPRTLFGDFVKPVDKCMNVWFPTQPLFA
jgi:hypothetical protein